MVENMKIETTTRVTASNTWLVNIHRDAPPRRQAAPSIGRKIRIMFGPQKTTAGCPWLRRTSGSINLGLETVGRGNRQILQIHDAGQVDALAGAYRRYGGKQLFAVVRSEIDKTKVGTTGWKENAAAAAGTSLCDLAERLASELRE